MESYAEKIPPVEITDDDFYELLEELDDQSLRERWENELLSAVDEGTMTLQAAYTKLGEVVHGRNEALNRLRAGVSAEASPELARERIEYIEMVRRSIREDNRIGSGAAADVYVLDDAPHLCVKVIRGQGSDQQGSNTVHQELDYLDALAHFSHQGVRTPKVIECISGGDLVIIIMEKLPAVDLDRVVRGVEELPKEFDVHDFFARLKEYMTQVHKTKQIYHGDLNLRNIMVDKNTGLPYIIDFGRSKQLLLSEGSAEEIAEAADLGKMADSYARMQRFLSVQQEQRDTEVN